MPQSPSDATRFTATGPYASSGAPFSSSLPPNASAATPSSQSGTRINTFGRPAPASESPQQKIARLRAAAALAKRGKESQFDQMVRVGRVWADRAHKATTYSLIGLSIVCGVVTVAGVSDMIIHNRRRKREWLAMKQAESAQLLAEAREAAVGGVATEDQILLLNRERAAWEADQERRNRPGVWKRTTGWLFSGLSKEEQKGGKFGSGAAGTGAGTGFAASLQGREGGQQEQGGVLRAVEEKIAEIRDDRPRPLGGPLDRQAQLVSDTIAGTSKSWIDWMTGR